MSACPKCNAVFMTFPHTCGLGTPHIAEFVPVEERPEEYIRQVRQVRTATNAELQLRIEQLESRLDAALRRMEAMENDHAKLKGPHYVNERHRIASFYMNRVPGQQSVDDFKPQRTINLTPLPCGCTGLHCGGHQADCHDVHKDAYAQAIDQKLQNIAASMDVVLECAGIELPDEGT